MNKVLTACLAIFLFSQTMPATADNSPIIVSCHGCTTKKAKLTADAQVPMSWSAGVYDVYVVDTPARKLRRFLVTAEREGRQNYNYVVARKPKPEFQGYFDDAISEWIYVSRALKPNIELEPGFPVRNAEQVFGSAFNQRVISEQINISVPSRIGSLFGAALQVLGAVFKVDVRLNALILFPDGSTALFELVRLDHLTSGHFFVYEYKKGSARDSDGNAIPDSVSAFENYQGTFSTTGNWNRFVRRAEIYGAGFLLGFTRQSLPAHSVCAIDDKGAITCWHN